METWRGYRDSSQASCSNRWSGIDLQFFRQNRSKSTQKSQCDALPETWVVAVAADQAGSHYGE
jgi:hypothetical protein